jgi:cytochrome oxidase Cu insertion factor (SCO1/SenC/PrrC family)
MPRGSRRWLLLTALLLLGVAVGSLIALLRVSSGRTRGKTEPLATPTAPPVRWASGKRPAPGFHLVDQSGRMVSPGAYRGRAVIVTFIDPLCHNFCPLEAKQLNALAHSLPRSSRPVILAVSVNLKGDSRATLLHDAKKWRLTPEWHWAVGSPKQLARVWRGYHVGVQVVTKKIAGITVREVNHTEAAYIVDARGYERALFLWPFQAQDVQAELQQLA